MIFENLISIGMALLLIIILLAFLILILVSSCLVICERKSKLAHLKKKENRKEIIRRYKARVKKIRQMKKQRKKDIAERYTKWQQIRAGKKPD